MVVSSKWVAMYQKGGLLVIFFITKVHALMIKYYLQIQKNMMILSCQVLTEVNTFSSSNLIN